jgi:hypothetical protein
VKDIVIVSIVMENAPSVLRMMVDFVGYVPKSHVMHVEDLPGGGVRIIGLKMVIGYAPGAIHQGIEKTKIKKK